MIFRKLFAALAAVAVLLTSQVNAGVLAPAPQIIAEYDRKFIERSGAQTFGELLDTGIIRYFFTGGRELLVMVNGRPFATTASNLDVISLSAVERIEVLRAESLGTIGGQAAVLGAFNLILRKDLDGFDIRAVTRLPTRDGGDAFQGSAVWGGAVSEDGHMTVTFDILDRQEIPGSTREHSRSEWKEGGSFAETKNVSLGGNTVFIYDFSEREVRSVSLGDCDPELGYTGPLSNPPGIRSGDKGCGYAYGNVWWDTASYKQKSTILNLNQPLGEDADLYVDANIAQSRWAFRYAPSVGTFYFRPDGDLLADINQSADNFVALSEDFFAIGHRFIGHGNRDWRMKGKVFDLSATIQGQLTENLGYDAYFTGYESSNLYSGDTFVDTEIIRQEIAAGRYDLADPLSDDPEHLRAIEKSSLRESDDFKSKFIGSRLALEGTGLRIGGRDAIWTAGIDFASVEGSKQLEFRASDGSTRNVSQVLGSGGTSYAGERDRIGAFAEISLPLTNSVQLRAAARADDYDDVGGLRAGRFGVEYRATDAVTLRGSLSAGDAAPSFSSLYSTVSLDHPYVRCVPESGQDEPRTCEGTHFRQVKRTTSGNPKLKPAGAQRHSLGFEFRKESLYLISDWYRLKTKDLPGQYSASWAILNYPEYVNAECSEEDSNRCIERRAGGDITIHDSYANIVNTEILGLNTRFGNRVDKDWGFVAFRGFWRYVDSGEATAAGETQRLALPSHAVRVVTSVGRGNLTAYWALNYRDEIIKADGSRFSSWTGHDLTLDWKKPFGLENTRFTTGVYNVTDTKLSINTSNPNFTDGPRAAGWGRTFFATFNIKF